MKKLDIYSKGKRDANEKILVKALKKLGFKVWLLREPMPDLLITRGDIFALVEVKSAKGKITMQQEIMSKVFDCKYAGNFVAKTIDDLIKIENFIREKN